MGQADVSKLEVGNLSSPKSDEINFQFNNQNWHKKYKDLPNAKSWSSAAASAIAASATAAAPEAPSSIDIASACCSS